MALKETCVWNRFEHGFLSRPCFQLVFHWVSKLIHLTRIRCSGWVRAAWIINEFEKYIYFRSSQSRWRGKERKNLKAAGDSTEYKKDRMRKFLAKWQARRTAVATAWSQWGGGGGGELLGEWKFIRVSAFWGLIAWMASALKIKCPTLPGVQVCSFCKFQDTWLCNRCTLTLSVHPHGICNVYSGT